MKRVVALVVFVGMMLGVTHQASAHVLISDQASKTSAILHIVPDDDPEAGKDAILFFALQSPVNPQTYANYRLFITNEANQTVQAAVMAGNHDMTVHYTFPAQGLYKLELKNPLTASGSFDLHYSLRVSRGIAGSSDQASRFGWTTPVIISVLTLGALLLLLFVNNFRAISKRSRF